MIDISGEDLQLINELWHQTFCKKAFTSITIEDRITVERSAVSLGKIFNGISRECSVFSCTVNLFHWLTLEIKTLRFFKMSVNVDSSSRRNVP
jgi:hypothetical protein